MREGQDAKVAELVRNDLVIRNWATLVDSFASRILETAEWSDRQRPEVLAFIPRRDDLRLRCFLRLRQVMEAGLLPILLVPEDIDIPDWVYEKGVRAVIPTGSLGYDRLFEDIFRALMGPLPVWLDVRVRPSQVLRPTGVAWWNEDVYVADERYEHVVRIGPVDSQVVLPGLFEPHHIHLDRRTLCVANKSADELLIANLVDDMATDVRSISDCDGPLRRPHDVRCHHFALAVADTDNHRVLISNNTNSFDGASWKVLAPERPFRAPCGLHGDRAHLWVADTFNHRIVGFDYDGVQVADYGSYGEGRDQFRYPVGLYSWQNYLFVADEESERLQVLRRGGADGTELEPYLSSFAAPWVRQVFGLSVNRENRLAIGDRKQKCVWLIDLERAMADPNSGIPVDEHDR
jgi:hypothetical protein